MMRMFPHNTRNVTGQNTSTNTNINLQFTNKIFTVSQIYNTKGSSCSSCGSGKR